MQGYARIFKDVVVKHAGFVRDEGILGKTCLNKCVNHEIKTCTELGKKQQQQKADLQMHTFKFNFCIF